MAMASRYLNTEEKQTEKKKVNQIEIQKKEDKVKNSQGRNTSVN